MTITAYSRFITVHVYDDERDDERLEYVNVDCITSFHHVDTGGRAGRAGAMLVTTCPMRPEDHTVPISDDYHPTGHWLNLVLETPEELVAKIVAATRSWSKS